MTTTDIEALAAKLEHRAKTYSWDSISFYASDATLMRQAAAALRAQREALAMR